MNKENFLLILLLLLLLIGMIFTLCNEGQRSRHGHGARMVEPNRP